VQGEGCTQGCTHPWNGATAGVERAERSGGLHKRSAEDWGFPLQARGAELPLADLYVRLSSGSYGGTAVLIGSVP
jgi:hypothetical protein